MASHEQVDVVVQQLFRAYTALIEAATVQEDPHEHESALLDMKAAQISLVEAAKQVSCLTHDLRCQALAADSQWKLDKVGGGDAAQEP